MNKELEISNYPFRAVESKWQKLCSNSYNFDYDSKLPKYYILEMFPYPSGNIHMGHLRNYSIGDVIARYKRATNYNVLHPMGFDAFGLPAENAAFQNNIHPRIWTEKNIKSMKEQLDKIGLSYDWNLEFKTCDSSYYKFEQKFFIELYEKGLAYQKESFVNWDPVDNTVLANEQVIDGKGWRSGAFIERRKIKSWFLKVSDYAEELLSELDNLTNWPKSVLNMQEKWIGKSIGATINFPVTNYNFTLEIYTTRPETIFGASFIGISPQHPLAQELSANNHAINNFITTANKVSTSQAVIDKMEKLGIDTGLKVKHPFLNNKSLPIYIANFVLMDYGSGAIFACPAHDQRDFDFAKKYDLDINFIISDPHKKLDKSQAYLGDGVLVNSDFLNGLSVNEARIQIIKYLEEKALGKSKINYRIRDWGISRQRYWGCPIPIINCSKCGAVPVKEQDLPVELPNDIDFSVIGNPLDNNQEWKSCKCPKCGIDAVRETETFDTFFESSWYFFRFLDAKNKDKPFTNELVTKYLPVDMYVGGIEHAVLHLLYARFFTKLLRDIGYHNLGEPFNYLLTQGMVINRSFKDSKDQYIDVANVVAQNNGFIDINSGNEVFQQRLEKMSKSKKNGVSPIQIIDGYGADTARLFMLSDSPPDKDLEWSDKGIEGAWRYLNRIYRFVCSLDYLTGDLDPKILNERQKKLFINLNKIIKRVTDDIEAFHFNKVVASLRELSNYFLDYKINDDEDKILIIYVIKNYAQMFYPIIPHFSLEIFNIVNVSSTNILKLKWPKYDENYLQDNIKIIAVQINGKLKTTFEISADASQDSYKDIVLNLDIIKDKIDVNNIKKLIIVPGKIVNIVV